MFKVCIRCNTYNHSLFIEDAMNGFVMQATDFPFVAAIVDDASTDNTQQLISTYFEKNFDINESLVAFQEETEYGKVLFARHNTNKNCFFGIVLLKENHYSKRKRKWPYLSRWIDNVPYIAICEGDDYWIDSNKLQDQVDYLDNHPQIGLVYNVSKVYSEKLGRFRGYCGNTSTFKQLLHENRITTASVCYRKEVRDRFNQEISIKKEWLMGDYPFYLFVSLNYGIHCINSVYSVYRELSESASHSCDVNKAISFLKSSHDVRIFFINKYHREDLLDKVLINDLGGLLNISLLYNKTISYRDFYSYASQVSNCHERRVLWLKYIAYSSSVGRKLLMIRHDYQKKRLKQKTSRNELS